MYLAKTRCMAPDNGDTSYGYSAVTVLREYPGERQRVVTDRSVEIGEVPCAAQAVLS